MSIKDDMQKEMNGIKNDLAVVNKAFHELKVEKGNIKIRNRNIAIVILAILLVVSNLAWAIYRTSLEKVTETTTTETYTFEGIEQNAEGSNYIVGGDINGKSEN